MSEPVDVDVREDPTLTPEEKETTVRFAKDQDVARVFTAEGGLARRLLAHDEASVVGVVVVEDDARPEVPLEEVGGRTVVGVRCDVPVGVLQIKRDPRQTPHHAPIVTDRVLAGGAGE